MQAKHADLVLGVRRQWDVADEVGEHDEQKQRADERKPLARPSLVIALPVMLLRISSYSTSTAAWTLFGRCCMRLAM